jgi:hypothetical protein
MNARVTFLEMQQEPPGSGDSEKDAATLYVVPKHAVMERETGTSVFVISDGTVQVKPITVEKEVGPDVFVSAGLVGTESIIVGDSLDQLKAGDRVEVRQ